MARNAPLLGLTVLAMLCLAVLMVHSAGATADDTALSISQIVTSRHAIYAMAALVAMWLASRIDLNFVFSQRRGHRLVIAATAIAIGLTALAMVPGLGPSINGSRRWLWLGPRSWSLTFQPSELVKWTMVITVAWWCAHRRAVMHRFWHGLVPPLLIVGIGCGLILIEDLGTAVLIGTVAVVLLWAGGARLWQLALLVPAAAGALVTAIISSPYRLGRLTSFLDPWADSQGAGYQAIQSMLAIAEGGLTGRGLGGGIQKFGYLPADTSDFLFAVICEELGIGGAALVIGAYILLLWLAVAIVRDCRDSFGRLLGLGIAVTIGCQAVMNIAVVCVVVPTKGIGLPLLSAGGSGWILTATALGLLAALDRANARDTLSTATPHANHGGPPAALVSSA